MSVEQCTVIFAHDQAVAWLMVRLIFRPWRDPAALREVFPLRLALVSRSEVE